VATKIKEMKKGKPTRKISRAQRTALAEGRKHPNAQRLTQQMMKGKQHGGSK